MKSDRRNLDSPVRPSPREVAVRWHRHREVVPVATREPREPWASTVPARAERSRPARAAALVIVAALAFGCATGNPAAVERGRSYEIDLAERADGLARSYRMHVPATDPIQERLGTQASPLPVVVVLHGAFSTPEQIERRSGWSELADEEGFLVLYPNGIGLFGFLQHWNAGHCCGKALADGVDDVGFVEQVLDDAASRVAIDRSRVYVTGFSNGAMLAHRLAAERPGTFAALAAVSGPPAGQSDPLERWWKIPSPEQPVPTLLFFGKADRTVPWSGRIKAPLRFPPALYSARLWAERNGCGHKPDRSLARDGRIETLDYPGCDGETVVRMHGLEGWGHRWPAPYFTERLSPEDPLYGFDATREIWRFFQGFERHQESRIAGTRAEPIVVP